MHTDAKLFCPTFSENQHENKNNLVLWDRDAQKCRPKNLDSNTWNIFICPISPRTSWKKLHKKVHIPIGDVREETWLWKIFFMKFIGKYIGFCLQQVDAPAGNTGSVIVFKYHQWISLQISLWWNTVTVLVIDLNAVPHSEWWLVADRWIYGKEEDLGKYCATLNIPPHC